MHPTCWLWRTCRDGVKGLQLNEVWSAITSSFHYTSSVYSSCDFNETVSEATANFLSFVYYSQGFPLPLEKPLIDSRLFSVFVTPRECVRTLGTFCVRCLPDKEGRQMKRTISYIRQDITVYWDQNLRYRILMKEWVVLWRTESQEPSWVGHQPIINTHLKHIVHNSPLHHKPKKVESFSFIVHPSPSIPSKRVLIIHIW